MCCSDGYQAGQVPRVSVSGAGQEAGAELQLLQEETIKGDYQVRIVIVIIMIVMMMMIIGGLPLPLLHPWRHHHHQGNSHHHQLQTLLQVGRH